MQVTNDKPRKVVMSRWEYIGICVMFYFVGYINGRRGWANMWHGLGWHTVWTFLVVLAISAPIAYWRYRRERQRPFPTIESS